MKKLVTICLIMLLSLTICEASALSDLLEMVEGLPTDTKIEIKIKKRLTQDVEKISKLETEGKDEHATKKLKGFIWKVDKLSSRTKPRIEPTVAEELLTSANAAIKEIRTGLEVSFSFTNQAGTYNEHPLYIGNNTITIQTSITNLRGTTSEFIMAWRIVQVSSNINIYECEEHSGDIPPGETYSFSATYSDPLPTEMEGLFEVTVMVFHTNGEKSKILQIDKTAYFWLEKSILKTIFSFVNANGLSDTEPPYALYAVDDTPTIETSITNLGTTPTWFIMAWRIINPNNVVIYECEEHSGDILPEETYSFSATSFVPLPDEPEGLYSVTVMIFHPDETGAILQTDETNHFWLE